MQIMSISMTEYMHRYLTRENAHIDLNGIAIPKNAPVQEHRIVRNRDKTRIVPCSAFGRNRHSRYKGQGFFFCHQCGNFGNL